jgi:two-component system response regulator FixJ
MTRASDDGELPARQGTLAVTNVAVVDDDASVRRGLERLLRSAGFSVVTFVSAEQFLAMCRRELLSCLLIDVHLAGMSGLELLARLVAGECPVPVILISAYDDPQTTQAIEGSGAVAYLRKPFDDQVLIHAIREAVAGRGGAGAPSMALD